MKVLEQESMLKGGAQKRTTNSTFWRRVEKHFSCDDDTPTSAPPPFVNCKATPKISVDNRLYAKKYLRNERIKGSSKELKGMMKGLESLNELTTLDSSNIGEIDETAIGGNMDNIPGFDAAFAQQDNSNTDCITTAEPVNLSSNGPCGDNSGETNLLVKRKQDAIEYVSTGFRQSKYAKLIPAPMPQPIPFIRPASFQPVCNRLAFVDNMPMTTIIGNPTATIALSSAHQRGTNMWIERGSDIMPRRSARRCLLYCFQGGCLGGKTRWSEKKNGTRWRYCPRLLLWLYFLSDPACLPDEISHDRQKILSLVLFFRGPAFGFYNNKRKKKKY
mmetsp:Transcript_1765/g.2101  ORF Transcript_1765/g.2101 Transcript_1765/m.2101 type:complete len:331 (+) Transcript_1765:1-993(+)